MVERTAERKIALVAVTNRDADLIATVILDHVNFGSIILSDGWSAYPKAIETLNDNYNASFTHKVVNHKKHFKGPDGTHINHIEGTWSGVKQNVAPRQMRIDIIDSKLIEFIWRRQNHSK